MPRSRVELTHLDEGEDQARFEGVLGRLAVGDLESTVQLDHSVPQAARDELPFDSEVLVFLLHPFHDGLTVSPERRPTSEAE